MNNNFKTNKYTLLFQESKLESQYYDNYVQEIRKPLRISILIGILIYSGFILIDYFVFPEKIFIIGLNRIIVGLIAFVTFLVTYLKNYSKYYNLIITGLFLVVGFGTVHLTFIEQIYINSVYSVIIFFSLIPHIRFVSAILINFSIISGMIGVLLIQSQINNKTSLLQSFLLISAGIVSLLVLYIKQSIERHNFLQSNNLFVQSIELKEKNEELQTAEEELRQNNEKLMELNENIQSQKDIIENKNQELHKYFTAIEQSEATIVFTDIEGNIEYANPQFSKLTGYTVNEALGKNPRVLKSGKTPKETFTNLWETISGGQTWKGEFINRKKDKTEFWESATISPVKNTNGVITAYIAIKEDITALKKYEYVLKAKNEELQTAEEELRQNNEELHTILEDLEYRKKELDKANKTLSSTNLKLDTANKEILAGINYASLIQKSMLTSEDITNTYLSEYFLIYKPKDIVSGDFYYVNKIENYLIIAVADCTGHGVSGAFITMLGITYIHDTITRKETNSTNTVLEIVRERFKHTFKTFGSDSKNGMDIALCALNLDTIVLQYSGANLPLWIVRKGNLIEHKPTRCPIGIYPVDIDFQQNEIQLEKNDTIYMFTDGIHDQLSDINLKKYQKNKFRTLILENTALSMENQKQKILENFENWKGVNYQTDDVTVLGFKI
jgi:PAS domain S-box-containing protein